MSDQLAIDFDCREDAIDRAFRAFHAANPQVMDTLVALTREALGRGVQRVGMKMLFELVRWERLPEVESRDFRLNNNMTSRYARAIMAANPDLAGVYETRELRPNVPRSLAAAAA